MNAKRVFSLITLVLIFFTAACGPTASTAVPIAVEGIPQSMPAQERPPQDYRPAPTQAPAPEFAPPPADNQFQDYGVNPETYATYDHLSTFALDVDTASYTVTRRYIEDGNLPPYDAVRVEEFINAFDQGYAAPYDAAFTVYADGAPAPRGYEEGGHILRFGIQGYRVDEFERKPAVLTFVIDVSGSMDMENRLGLVKRSLQLLVDRLDSRDTVSIVVYSNDARVLLEPTSGDQRDRIMDAIRWLQPEDSTNVEDGLKLGYWIAEQSYQEGAINRVVLCSDGVANVGSTHAETILQEAQRYAGEGIYLTTIGVGMGNFNDVLLEQLADNGDGNYAYVDTIDQAEKVFVDDLVSTLQVIAKDAKVQVDFNTDVVASYRLLGYENRAVADQAFRDDSVDAGELGAGHTATALYNVQIKPGAEGRIATVSLRWEDPDSREVKEINGNFNTWDLVSSFEESDPRYQLTVLVAQFAEVLRMSPYVRISLGDLARRARWVADRLPEDPMAAEFAELVTQAAWIRGE